MICQKTILIFVALLLLYPTVVIGENDNLWWDMAMATKAKEGCVSFDGRYIPEELLTTVKRNPDGTLTMFEGKTIIDLAFAYRHDIDEKLKQAADPNNKSAAMLLDCAIKLGDSEEKALSEWYTRHGIENANKNILTPDTFSDTIYHSSLEVLCKQYNEIALRLERKNMLDQAEDIYRKVLRKFDWTKGCFKEAEIGLQNLRTRPAR